MEQNLERNNNLYKLMILTGKPYVKKLIVKYRKTVLLKNTFACLTPDLFVAILVQQNMEDENGTKKPKKKRKNTVCFGEAGYGGGKK